MQNPLNTSRKSCFLHWTLATYQSGHSLSRLGRTQSACGEGKMWLKIAILLLSGGINSVLGRSVAMQERSPSITKASLDTSSSSNATSPPIKVMYYNHHYGIQRRDSARLMDKCIGYDSRFYRYATSRCLLETDVRAVAVSCVSRLLPTTKESRFDCLDTEMCWEHHRRAYCISTSHFLAVQAASPEHPHPHNAFAIQLPKSTPIDQVQIAKGILTDTSSKKPLQAESITLLALREGELYGRSACHNCNSTELDPVPKQAQVLWVSISMKQKGNAGVLQLSSFSHEE